MRSRPQYYSDSFKLGVIQRVLSGELTKDQAKIEYGIGGNSVILEWMRTFGYPTDSPSGLPMKNNTVKSTPNDPEELKKQIKQLQRRLELEQQRSEFYQSMIDIAERELGIAIRKKFDTKP
ncbi:MAG: hypothetical protein WD361_03895 [Gracilimonas sp.]